MQVEVVLKNYLAKGDLMLAARVKRGPYTTFKHTVRLVGNDQIYTVTMYSYNVHKNVWAHPSLELDKDPEKNVF